MSIRWKVPLRISAAVLWLIAVGFAVVGLAMMEGPLTDVSVLAGIAAGCATLGVLVERAMTVVVNVVAYVADDVPVAAGGSHRTVDEVMASWRSRSGGDGIRPPEHRGSGSRTDDGDGGDTMTS